MKYFLAICLLSCLVACEQKTKTIQTKESIEMSQINDAIQTLIEKQKTQFDSISEERKEVLMELAEAIKSHLSEQKNAQLTFICTHNSRRSHLSQIWAQTLAEYYGVAGISTYSGGTEATAFNERAVAAMKKQGFDITKTNENKNPVYEVKWSDSGKGLMCFSKIYNDAFNPQSGYIAVMTCSDADENCPIVHGAKSRIAVPYDDPKNFDGTELESIKYLERSEQIALELNFVFAHVKS